jgi:hypothetical protein
LVGIAFLPLKVQSIVTVAGRPLTYLYHNTPTDLKDVSSKRTVGVVHVSIALGEIEHQSVMDPNAPPIPTPAPAVVAPPPPQALPKAKTRRRRSTPSDYSYSSESSDDDEEDWQAEAAKHGWIKPGSGGPWKEKARKKGWTPPTPLAPCYGVATECDLMGQRTRAESAVQVDLDLPEGLEEPASFPEIEQVVVQHDIDELFRNKGSKMDLQRHPPIFSMKSKRRKPKLTVQPADTLFDSDSVEKLKKKIDDFDNDSELDDFLIQQVSQLQEGRAEGEIGLLSDDSGDEQPDEKLSDEEDFLPAGDLSAEVSELVVATAKKSSSGSGKRPPVVVGDESTSSIFHSPVGSRSSKSTKSVEEEDASESSGKFQSLLDAGKRLPKAGSSKSSESEFKLKYSDGGTGQQPSKQETNVAPIEEEEEEEDPEPEAESESQEGSVRKIAPLSTMDDDFAQSPSIAGLADGSDSDTDLDAF